MRVAGTWPSTRAIMEGSAWRFPPRGGLRLYALPG